jgi:hypothetical protein
MTMIGRKERLARPAWEMMRASWFLRATSLPTGLATPEIQVTLHLLSEVKVGKRQKGVDLFRTTDYMI